MAGATQPIGDDEFAALMAPLGPFGPRPRLAVGVSGGPDSMALCLLAARWAKALGGEATALTVDHGLRPESAAEAQTVAARLSALDIPHRTLRWHGPRPAGNLQARARAARHGLLAAWCAANGAAWLALAHHRDDQAETLLLRLARGSGLYGLAAMAPWAARANVVVLRPLLAVAESRLLATCRARGVAWIEDPSNQDRAYDRVRMRLDALPALAGAGIDATRLAATAARLGRARAALEEDVAGLLAVAAAPHPFGFIRLLPGPIGTAPAEVGLRALARLLAAVGGAAYPPRLSGLERLHAALAGPGALAGVTLGGCQIVSRQGALLVCREPAAITAEVALPPGATVRWDRRFALHAGPEVPAGARVARLGASGYAAVARSDRAARAAAQGVPAPARAALPAIFDERGVLSVPHLGYNRYGMVKVLTAFAPDNPATTGGYSLAPGRARPIY